MPTTTKVKYGDNLHVTDEGGGVIRVDASPGSGAGAGGDASFVFTQGSPSATWNIVHGLGKNPSVTVVDTGGTEVIPSVLYIDVNTLTVTFGSPTSGKAYLN